MERLKNCGDPIVYFMLAYYIVKDVIPVATELFEILRLHVVEALVTGRGLGI